MGFIHGFHRRNLKGDLLGGLTAAVVALPLALAFGNAALGPGGAIYGLYGAIVTGFLAALLGGTPAQVSGPTGPMSVTVAGVVSSLAAVGVNQDLSAGEILPMVMAAVVIGGVCEILLGVLRLGRFILIGADLIRLPDRHRKHHRARRRQPRRQRAMCDARSHRARQAHARTRTAHMGDFVGEHFDAGFIIIERADDRQAGQCPERAVAAPLGPQDHGQNRAFGFHAHDMDMSHAVRPGEVFQKIVQGLAFQGSGRADHEQTRSLLRHAHVIRQNCAYTAIKQGLMQKPGARFVSAPRRRFCASTEDRFNQMVHQSRASHLNTQR